jgi:hypothetical protein
MELFFLMIPLSAKFGLVIPDIPEDSSMLRVYALGSALAALFLPATAFAHGWGRSTMASFYAPAMNFVDPCVIYVPVCPPQMQAHGIIPGPTPRQGPRAAPSAAPPSSGPIPSGKGPPAVTESRSFYESFGVQPGFTDKISADHCAVGFWNLTGRDVTLSVDGKPQIVPQGKSLRLQLGRQFAWKIGGHEVQTERIPIENSGVEIVLRRQ